MRTAYAHGTSGRTAIRPRGDGSANSAAYGLGMEPADPARDLRTCDRCGASMSRDLMVVAFLGASGSPRLTVRDLHHARCEVWCDDCCAEQEPFWVMVSGDPAEDRDTVEAVWSSGYTDRLTFGRAWARLRDGWLLDRTG